jgi:dihydroflavonol-4-reductase
MNILVTGASGFIGSHLALRLAKEGHAVRTFGRGDRPPASLAGCLLDHRQGDITDKDDVRKALVGCEAVFHLAGLVSYKRSDQPLQYRINVLGTTNVMSQAAAAGVTRVVHTSSIAAMGIPAPGSVGDESITYNLAGKGLNYCDTKHRAELEVMKYFEQGLPVLMLNPGIVFGEGDTHPHHHAIITALSKGWLVGCPGGGVSFCDIDDVVAAHVNALTMGTVGERYVLASENLTFLQAASLVSRLLGQAEPRLVLPGWLLEPVASISETLMPAFGLTPSLTKQVAWLSQHKIFFSAAKAVSELKYPQTPFLETIKRTLPFYLGRRP